jgi:hypothetical protein
MSGSFEDRVKLRVYLVRHRVNGKLNEPQQAAWDALNEVDDLVHILKLVRQEVVTLDRAIEVDMMIRRNSPNWAVKRG